MYVLFITFVCSYPLAEIAQKAVELCTHSHKVSLENLETENGGGSEEKLGNAGDSARLEQSMRGGTTKSKRVNLVEGFTLEVLEEATEEGVAEYVAYRDGRVHAKFFDRTILEISIFD